LSYALDAALVLWLVAVLCFLVGCGTTRDSQTKTVEKEELILGPMIVETPVGAVTVQPTRIIRLRTQDEVTVEEKKVNMPEGGAIITAAANSTPWGGIIASVVALGTTAWGGKKALEAGKSKRHFEEVVDGIERSKEDLGDKWDALVGNLEAEQSRDTKTAVKARVG
jgi:hypothetical protein